MTDNSTYENQAELAQAIADPRYATSPRYREEVAAKLRTSVDAGVLSATAERIAYDDTIHTYSKPYEPEGMYNPTSNPMPKSDQKWVQAAKIGSGVFSGPGEIAAARAAPHYDLDAGYRRALEEKIARSIRGGHINADHSAVDQAGSRVVATPQGLQVRSQHGS